MPDVHEEDVLIKVASWGVCHTDLKVVEGRNGFTPPTSLDDEVAGTFEQIGADCKDLKIGVGSSRRRSQKQWLWIDGSLRVGWLRSDFVG